MSFNSGTSPALAGAKTETKQKMSLSQFFINYGAVIAFSALFLFNVIFTPNFFTVDTVFLIIKQATTLMFVTVGMTIVISAGGNDISVGSMMGFSGVITAALLVNGMSLWVAAPIAIVVCAFIGLFNGFVIARIGVQPIILTLVMQIALRGMTVMFANSTIISLADYDDVKLVGIKRIFGVVPIQAVYFAVAVLIACFIVKKTTLGKYVEAIGESKNAARLVGIRTVFITIVVYVLSAVFASVAGVLEMSRSGALDPNLLGKMYEMEAIAAVAIGGTQMKGGKIRIMGSILGCLLMIMIDTTVNMNGVPFSYSNLIKAIIIIFALAIQCEKTN